MERTQVKDPFAPSIHTCWVHDANTSTADVLINPATLPFNLEPQDLLRLYLPQRLPNEPSGNVFYFRAPEIDKQKDNKLGNMQVSVSQGLAQALGISNRDEVVICKIIPPLPDGLIATHIEIFFKDQYISRPDMHRTTLALIDNFSWAGQRVYIPGTNIKVRVGNLKRNKKQKFSAYITHDTKVIFRSDSAKFHVFLQLSKEMWFHDIDGSLFFEKTVDLFLPELVKRWKHRNTNHIVSIIICARIFYTDEEAELLKQNGEQVTTSTAHDGRHFRDIYKVLVDLETQIAWDQVIPRVKEEFLNFGQNFLSPPLDSTTTTSTFGTISSAHNGNVLEAINLATNAFSHHYVDRDLQRTGLSVLVITAGTCQYHVDKNLLRLTGERMIDLGGAVDIVSLNKMPLHQVPLFSFYSHHYDQITDDQQQNNQPRRTPSSTYSSIDPLYNDCEENEDSEIEAHAYHGHEQGVLCRKKHYVVPAWVDSSFFSRQPDKPFRVDRFMPRCKMSGITAIDRPFVDKPRVDNALSSFPTLIDEDLPKLIPPAPLTKRTEREKREFAREKYDAATYGNRKAMRELSGPRLQQQQQSNLDRRENVPKTQTSIKFDLAGGSNLPSTRDTPPRQAVASNLEIRSATPESSTRSSLPPMRLHTNAVSLLHNRNPTSPETTGTTSPSPSHRSSVSYSGSSLQSVPIPSATSNISASGSSSRTSDTLTTPSHSFTPSLISRLTSQVKAHQIHHSESTNSDPNHGNIQHIQHKSHHIHYLHHNSHSTNSWFWPLRLKPKRSHTSGLATLIEHRSPLNNNNLGLPDNEAEVTPTPSENNLQQDTLQSSSQNANELKEPINLNTNKQKPIVIGTNNKDNKDKDKDKNQDCLHDHDHDNTLDGTLGAVVGSVPRSNSTAAGFPPSVTNSGPLSLSPETPPPLQRMSNFHYQYSKYEHFNPSNPKKNRDTTIAQRKRWENIFSRRASDQRSVKWRSLCTPASLPLYTDFHPSSKELQKDYSTETYTFPITECPSSIFVKPSSSIEESAAKIFQEMVIQRLSQNFQIVVFNDASVEGDSSTLPSVTLLSLLESPLKVNGSILLSMSNHIHKISYDRDNCQIQVTIYRKLLHWSKNPYYYSFSLWAKDARKLEETNVEFVYPSLEDFDFEYLDRLIAGLEKPVLKESLRYWRARFSLIPAKVTNRSSIVGASNETLDKSSSDEEIRLAGILRILEQFNKMRWKPPSGNADDSGPKTQYVFTTSDPGIFIRDQAREAGLHMLRISSDDHATRRSAPLSSLSLEEVAKLMKDEQYGVGLADRRWHLFVYEDTFIGHELIDWLLDTFPDIQSRDDAIKSANDLYDRGLFVHVRFSSRRILDGYFYYRLKGEYKDRERSRGWFRKNPRSKSRDGRSDEKRSSSVVRSNTSGRENGNTVNKAVKLSNILAIDLDPNGRSERAEIAFLHYDVAHHPNHAFHIQIDWLCKPSSIQELIMSYNRMGERYGLLLVEENIRQIKDINIDNPLQRAVHIPLSYPPPDMGDAAYKVPESTIASLYLERRLLERLGYLLDLEADNRFPDIIEPDYIYRATKVDHVQFVHLSGAGFVQILGGDRGFLFLKNRLFLAHRTGMEGKDNELRNELETICSRPDLLKRVWDEELANLDQDEKEYKDYENDDVQSSEDGRSAKVSSIS